MTREQLLDDTIRLIELYDRVALQWPTGLGKSRATVLMLNHLECITRQKLSVLLLVAESIHKDNWEKEFTKWKLSEYIDITIECYASMKNYSNTEWDVCVFDEAHHLRSDIRMDVLSSITMKKAILLSATLPESLKLSLEEIVGKITISHISLKEAMDWGILPEPRVYLIPMTLDNSEPLYEVIEERGKSSLRRTVRCSYEERWRYRNKNTYPHIKLIMKCTARQKYNWIDDKYTYWKKLYMQTRQEYAHRQWMQMGLVRKKFLGEMKTAAAHSLLESLHNRRYICFCASIEQAEMLGGLCSSWNNVVHSKVKNPQQVIDKFNEGEIDNLFAVNMLQEGQNLNNIEVGVIIQLDGQERAFIQKFGRVLRADSPIQYVFYYSNTRDEEYLKSVLKNVDSEYITIMDRDEIDDR